MNTIRSVGYGWVWLIIAGGGSYYFAKRSINKDRAERAELEEKRRQQRERMRVQEDIARRANTAAKTSSSTALGATKTAGTLHVPGEDGNVPPSNTAGFDPAAGSATRTQYAAPEPFRARKGDRFS